MKLNEILTEELLDEKIKLRHVLAGAALGAALGTGGVAAVKHETPTQAAREMSGKIGHHLSKTTGKVEDRVKDLTARVLSKFKHNVKPEEAKKIVTIAIKNETPHFKAEDMLAMISVESAFKEKQHGHEIKSKLRHDPAIGLTQIRPAAWNLKPSDLDTPEKQIKKSYEILEKTRKMVGDNKDAIFHAYNVGVKNFKRKKHLNYSYPQKIKQELKRFET